MVFPQNRLFGLACFQHTCEHASQNWECPDSRVCRVEPRWMATSKNIK